MTPIFWTDDDFSFQEGDPMPSSYILRNLDKTESKDFVKAGERARGEGRSMRWIVARLVGLYARVGLDVLERAAAAGEGASK